MRHTRPTMGFAFALAAAVSVGANAAPLVAERVTFDSLDRDATGVSVRLTALRYSPEGAATACGARMRVRHDVPNGANPGKGVTIAGNSTARDDAYAQVKAILRANIGDGARSSAQDRN